MATLRDTLILPVVLCPVYIGAFEVKRQWGDLSSLLFFGFLGWTFKHLKWPRPPLVLGFILGSVIERYLRSRSNATAGPECCARSSS
jgi:TctA family transporter